MSTDKDWEKWGSTDPYFGVISSDEFRNGIMSAQARREFFRTGVEHVTNVMNELRSAFAPTFSPKSALDFGCGVGRLVIPLAGNADHITGVDVSRSMLAEARRNCEQARIHNVTFVESNDDTLSCLQGSFDLIHSYIVLPHIPWRRGRTIIHALADRVAPQGCLALQILSACTAPAVTRMLVRLRYVFPPANWLRNLVRSRPIFEPTMQLHVYDLEAISSDLKQHGFTCTHIDVEIPNFCSTYIYAQRQTTNGPRHGY